MSLLGGAEKLEQERNELAAQVERLRKERDTAEANANCLESALDGVVSLLNNYSGYLSLCDETIHAEAALEIVYRSRQRAQEADNANPNNPPA